MSAAYEVLLFYNFTPVERPALLRDQLEAKCRELNILGRFLVAEEGVNGACSGLPTATAAFRHWLSSDPRFADTQFKIEQHDGHAFHRLQVQVKPELVHLRLDRYSDKLEELNPRTHGGAYLEPEEFRQWLHNPPEDLVILDARSDYEWKLGRFRGAEVFPIKHFRDLPEQLAQREDLKDKTVVTYCTGGIKCEKLTPWMKQIGFSKVYQLHGGVIEYARRAQGEGWEGQCYVFDDRVQTAVNHIDPQVVGQCQRCGAPTEKMINCANALCNKHLLQCEACCEELLGCCSTSCYNSPKRRVWDGTGQYWRGEKSKLACNQQED